MLKGGALFSTSGHELFLQEPSSSLLCSPLTFPLLGSPSLTLDSQAPPPPPHQVQLQSCPQRVSAVPVCGQFRDKSYLWLTCSPSFLSETSPKTS